MHKWMILAVILTLAGCASQPCEVDQETDPRTRRMLFDNDLLQAKLLITSGPLDALPLADALLQRSAALYQGVSRIRQGEPLDPILEALHRAASLQHPHALALLYKIYSEPFLVARPDRDKAARYRAAYAELDVAKSGYPSFPRALMVVDRLVNPPPEFARRR